MTSWWRGCGVGRDAGGRAGHPAPPGRRERSARRVHSGPPARARQDRRSPRPQRTPANAGTGAPRPAPGRTLLLPPSRAGPLLIESSFGAVFPPRRFSSRVLRLADAARGASARGRTVHRAVDGRRMRPRGTPGVECEGAIRIRWAGELALGSVSSFTRPAAPAPLSARPRGLQLSRPLLQRDMHRRFAGSASYRCCSRNACTSTAASCVYRAEVASFSYQLREGSASCARARSASLGSGSHPHGTGTSPAGGGARGPARPPAARSPP